MGIARIRPVVVVLALAGTAWGQDRQPGTGARVVTRYARPITDGERVVDDGSRFRVYTIQGTAGDRLKVASGEVRGWIDAEGVVTLDRAIAFYTAEIEDNPNNASAYNWRGMVRKELGDEARALADYDEAVRIEPRAAFAHNNRGIVRLARKEFDRAIVDFDDALRLDPRHVLALCNRGIARRAKRQYEEALADHDRAIAIDPTFATPYNERAWLWATCPDDRHRDGDRAVVSATRACELTAWKDAAYIDTLAASYAEMGFFEQATRYQRKAIAQARPGTLARKEFAARLALYEKKLPYREP